MADKKKPKKQELTDATVIMTEPKNPKEKAQQMKYLTRREKETTVKGWHDEAKVNAKKKGVPYAKEYAAEDAQRRKVSREENEAYRKATRKPGGTKKRVTTITSGGIRKAAAKKKQSRKRVAGK